MKIKNNIEKYLEEEKQLSEYKLQLLQAGELKQYKERLILKEKDFLNFDFSKISFSSLEEVRDAVLLFKTSREDFDAKYGDSKKKSLEKITEHDIRLLDDKILFFEEKYKWILDKKIKEINIADNQTIRSLLKNPPANIESLPIAQIKKIEGSIIGKYRGRLQIILYCIARYFFTEIKKIKQEVSGAKDITYSLLKDINVRLFSLFNNYNKYIYKYFNMAKVELPPLLCGSNGENLYLDSIHSLKNIVPEIEEFSIKKIADSSTDIYQINGSIISKKFAERAYGINTGIKRVGNESIDILYMEVYDVNGFNLTSLLSGSFFNNYIDGDYIKSISTIPMWDLIREIENTEISFLFNSFFDENSQIFYDKINKGLVDPILLSTENSIILVPETRSDAEHIQDAEKVIDLLIKSFKKEYQERFDYYLPDILEESSRKNTLKRFLEPE